MTSHQPISSKYGPVTLNWGVAEGSLFRRRVTVEFATYIEPVAFQTAMTEGVPGTLHKPLPTECSIQRAAGNLRMVWVDCHDIDLASVLAAVMKELFDIPIAITGEPVDTAQQMDEVVRPFFKKLGSN